MAKTFDPFEGIEFPNNEEMRKQTGRAKQAQKLTGKKRPDQSKRMSGKKNIMAGKVSPNRGRAMPQIGDKVRGKKKPEGHGAAVSRARKGVPNLKALGVARPDHSNAMKDLDRNKGAELMKVVLTCPHCGKTSNGPNYTRWHGDNCKAKQ